MKQTKKIKNWTAPGKDEVHGFWLKHLTELHDRLTQHMNYLLQTGTIEDWITTGKITLLMKSKEKGAITSNYHPIICSPTTFKLNTAIITKAVQNCMKENELIRWEQKGNRRNSISTKDQLFIDKMILCNSWRRTTNLQVA